jgi:hypothetical protein
MKPPIRLASAGIVAASLLAGTAICSAAKATPVAFSFNYTYGGGTGQTYTLGGPGTLLSNAVSVTEGTTQRILTIDDVFGPAAGAVGDTITYLAAPVAIAPSTTGDLIGQLSISWDGKYNFTSDVGTFTRVPAQDALNFTWVGTFSDSTGVLNTQGATVSQTWSQAASGIEPSTGGTFNTNPSLIAPPIPEPAAMSLLATGLLGLVAIRRRRRTAA